MSKLAKILDFMKQKEKTFDNDYFIPKKWNVTDFKNFKTDSSRDGEINVNPYEYFCQTVENGIINNKSSKKDAPLIYSVIPRSLTAWDHSKKDKIENGTFLKLIALLPLLKKYGITVIYLLPICSHGEMNMKGELGSPYAIRNFYEIDSMLHDPLYGEFSEEKLHDEFAAFVEACHLLSIKVMLDFAFRTVSRDNVLISEHPDWFYWIKESAEKNFTSPKIPGLEAFSVNKKNFKILYESESTRDYKNSFSLAPNLLSKEKWEKAVKEGKTSVSSIKELFKVTTAPGFSDVVNDVQPAWTDVTYLKYYLDYPAEVKDYVSENEPPFIMQDGASLNVIHGEKKNEELWKYIADVLPFYYRNYKIDGARIDMSHAMPPELNAEIIRKIKEVDPEFILFSEEFNPNKSGEAKKDGFSLLSGFTYAVFKSAKALSFNKELLENNMLKTKIPMTSAIETPDTPRSMFNFKDAQFVKLLYIISNFLPMGEPMLNSGNELFEVQPMNLGLDNTEEGRFVLPKSDPMYGKLAFFDNYRLHWTEKSALMEKTILDIKEIRRKYRNLLIKKSNFILNEKYLKNKKITVLPYSDKTANRALIVVANRDSITSARCPFEKLFNGIENIDSVKIIYNKDGFCDYPIKNCKTVKIAPNEALIFSITCKGE